MNGVTVICRTPAGRETNNNLYILIPHTIYCKEGEKKMTKNTPEALQKIAETLLIDLEKTADCSEWECSECPFRLKEVEYDSLHGRHNCGWLLLKSATSKILRK